MIGRSGDKIRTNDITFTTGAFLIITCFLPKMVITGNGQGFGNVNTSSASPIQMNDNVVVGSGGVTQHDGSNNTHSNDDSIENTTYNPNMYRDYVKEHFPEEIDHFFLLIMSIIIFFMQCGFAFMEAGAVRLV